MRADRVLATVWFDTEDYADPRSDDAALRLAEILTDLGVTGNFKLVGEKLRAMERRGRRDVIAALAKHDIGFHSDWHTRHPTVPEYLVEAGWDDGVNLFLQYEGQGVADIERVFGQKPTTYGQAGNAWAPQAYSACKQLGISVYADDGPHLNVQRLPHYYCGLLGIFGMGDALVHVPARKPDFLDEMKSAFDRAVNFAKSSGGGVVSLWTHEVEFSNTQFADGLNFAAGKNPASDLLVPPPPRNDEDMENAYRQFKEVVAYAMARDDVSFVTPTELAAALEDRAAKARYGFDSAVGIAEDLLDQPGYVRVQEGWLSAAEAFSVVAKHLVAACKGNCKAWIEPVSLLGPKGLVDIPNATDSASINGGLLMAELQRILPLVQQEGALPSSVAVGFSILLPEALLRACCRALLEVGRTGEVPAEVEADFVPLAAEAQVADDSDEIWRWCLRPGFRAPRMMQLAKRQAWTLKPAIRL